MSKYNIRNVNPHVSDPPEEHHGRNITEARRILPPVGIPVNKIRKQNKGSATAGRAKGGSCQASAFDRIHARRNGSWKWPTYSAWIRRMNKKYEGVGGTA